MPKSKIITLKIDGRDTTIEISHFYRRFLAGDSKEAIKLAVQALWDDQHPNDETDFSGAIAAMSAGGNCSYSETAEAALAYFAGKKAVYASLAIQTLKEFQEDQYAM